MTDQQEPSSDSLTVNGPNTHGQKTSNKRFEELMTHVKEQYSCEPGNEEESPSEEIQKEQHIVKCIYNRIEKTKNESKKLKDLASNGLVFPRQWLPSPEYKAEIRHVSGIQNYGLPQSAMLGGMAYGFLSSSGIRPCLSAPFSALVTLYCSLEFLSRANTFETTPLVPGRSAYAEEVCPVVSEMYQEMVPAGYEPKGKSLRMFEGFMKNCMRRKSQENQIRNDKGLEKDAPVSIPYPGVPSNYPLSIVHNADLVSNYEASIFVVDHTTFSAQKIVDNIYKKKK